MKYEFKDGSIIDRRISLAWEESDNYSRTPRNWIRFVKRIAESATTVRYDRQSATTVMSFDDESALSMFLLRWS